MRSSKLHNLLTRFTFFPRIVTGITSAALIQALEEPSSFALKLTHRLSISRFTPQLHSIVSQRSQYRSSGNPSADAKRTRNPLKIRALRSNASILRTPLGLLDRNTFSTPYTQDVDFRFPDQGVRDSTNRVLLYLTNSLPHTQSGYTLRTHALLKSLAETDVQVTPITRPHYPMAVGRIPKGNREMVDGIEYQRITPWLYSNSESVCVAQAIEGLTQVGLSCSANLIHTTTDFRNGIPAAFAASKLGIPWIYEIRGKRHQTWLSGVRGTVRDDAKNSEYYTLASSLEVELSLRASGVITLSEIHRRELIDQGVKPERILTLPNSVDDSWLHTPPLSLNDKKQIRSALKLPENAFIFGSVTSVVQYEGLDLLVRALPKLPEHFYVLIVGNGEALPTLRQLAKDLGVTHRVIFPGRKSSKDIKDWYLSLDRFVIPRRNVEVCRTVTPLKATQAQALRIPVIASDLPALREVTGELASFIEPDDVDALVAALLEGESSDQGASSTFASSNTGADLEAARSFAATRTWSKQAKELEQFYRRILRLEAIS